MSHNHPVVEAIPLYQIDPETRAISLPEGATEMVIMQGDHKSKRLGFTIPKTIDGHDMSKCTRVEVHFTNNNDTGATVDGVCLAEDLAVSEDNVTCSWLIPGDCTGIAGNLDFSLSFLCTSGEEITYAWGTDEYTGLKVKPKRNHSKTTTQNPPDVLEQYKKEIIEEVTATMREEGLGLPDASELEDGILLGVQGGTWGTYGVGDLYSENLETDEKLLVGGINELKNRLDGVEETVNGLT